MKKSFELGAVLILLGVSACGSTETRPSIDFAASAADDLAWQQLIDGVWLVVHEEPFASNSLVAEMDDVERIDLAFRLALSRPPTSDETEGVLPFMTQTRNSFADPDSAESGTTAWAGFCQTLFAASEFRYLQ